MANKELIFQNVARDLGAGQFFALKLIDGGTVYTMYLEELTQPPRQPAVASQILATGVPIIAPSGAGDVIGIGTTGNLPLWTDGPNSVIGDSVLTQNAGSLIQPTGNLTLTLGNIVLTAGNLTLSAGRASIVPAVNTSPLTVSGYSLTGANTQPVLDLSGTWNTSGAATGIKLNVTNTASGAALLMDLQIGSISQFSVSKAGVLAFTGAIAFPDGVRQTFNPDATTPGFNVGSQAGDPSTPANGDLWYDSTGNLLRARISGGTVSLGAVGVPFNLTGISATAFTVAAAGTDYQLQVDTSVASAVTGIKITGAASGSGITLSAISSGATENIILTPKGTAGKLNITDNNAAGSANITIGTGTTTGFTFFNAGWLFYGTGVQGAFLQSAVLRLPAASFFGWSATADSTSASDLALARSAAGVLALTQGTGTTGTGWLNWQGDRRMTADLPNLTTTFANLTDLTISNIVSGRKYTGRMVVKCNNTTATEGIKFDFNGGSATISAFWAVGSVSAGGTTVLGTVISTSLAGVINFTTITGETLIIIEFSFVASGSGTLIPRFAENSTAVGTATVELGSFVLMHDSVN